MHHAVFSGRGGGRPLLGSLAGICLAAGLLAAPAARADSGAYAQRNLVSDGSVPADHRDPNLINARGIAFTPTGMAWIAANGTSISTVYDGQGNALPLSAEGVGIPGGQPTGIVANDGEDFLVPADGNEDAEPSALIFATEAGIISGWNPDVDATEAIAVVDNSATGAVYKGLALAANGLDRFLYATDFHGSRVDVFDADFEPIPLPAGAFQDPDLPAGFAPFGIHNIQGNLYVTYARQDEDGEDCIPGAGIGLVNVFDPDGRLIRRLATGGQLNAPWGMALAPANFGPFSNHLLVANFGDGRINAYDLASGEFRGQIGTAEQHPLAIDGLWGIRFGNGVLEQPTNVLFFTAGPSAAEQGLYGRIEPVAAPRVASSAPPPAARHGTPRADIGPAPEGGQAALPLEAQEDLAPVATVKTVDLGQAPVSPAAAVPEKAAAPVVKPAPMVPIHLETPYPYNVPAME